MTVSNVIGVKFSSCTWKLLIILYNWTDIVGFKNIRWNVTGNVHNYYYGFNFSNSVFGFIVFLFSWKNHGGPVESYAGAWLIIQHLSTAFGRTKNFSAQTVRKKNLKIHKFDREKTKVLSVLHCSTAVAYLNWISSLLHFG